MKTKCWLFLVKFIVGEVEYIKKGVIESAECCDELEAEIEKRHLSDFWGKDTTKEDDYYVSPSGGEAAKIIGIRNITKRDFNVLCRYVTHLPYVEIPEKVEFS